LFVPLLYSRPERIIQHAVVALQSRLEEDGHRDARLVASSWSFLLRNFFREALYAFITLAANRLALSVNEGLCPLRIHSRFLASEQALRFGLFVGPLLDNSVDFLIPVLGCQLSS